MVPIIYLCYGSLLVKVEMKTNIFSWRKSI